MLCLAGPIAGTSFWGGGLSVLVVYTTKLPSYTSPVLDLPRPGAQPRPGSACSGMRRNATHRRWNMPLPAGERHCAACRPAHAGPHTAGPRWPSGRPWTSRWRRPRRWTAFRNPAGSTGAARIPAAPPPRFPCIRTKSFLWESEKVRLIFQFPWHSWHRGTEGTGDRRKCKLFGAETVGSQEQTKPIFKGRSGSSK